MTMPAVNSSHFLIVGAGAIAERHLNMLRRLVPQSRFTVWRRRSIGCGDGVEIVHTLSDAIASSPRAAIIASPASHHLEAAMPLAEEGVDLFIEKPLAMSLDGVEGFLRRCEELRIVLQVGYCLRFTAGFAALTRILATAQSVFRSMSRQPPGIICRTGGRHATIAAALARNRRSAAVPRSNSVTNSITSGYFLASPSRCRPSCCAAERSMSMSRIAWMPWLNSPVARWQASISTCWLAGRTSVPDCRKRRHRGVGCSCRYGSCFPRRQGQMGNRARSIAESGYVRAANAAFPR